MWTMHQAMSTRLSRRGDGHDNEHAEMRWPAIPRTSNGNGALSGRLGRQVVHVVNHGDEEIEEQFAAILHLLLHGAAALEGVTGPDDESEVVCAKLRVVVGSVGVGKASRGQDGAALDTGLKTLLAESKLLQFGQTILLSSAVEDGVLEDGSRRSLDDSFLGAVSVAAVLKAPGSPTLVVTQTRVVVALVEKLEDR